MTQTAKVVIVMATYNGTQFLGKQIESIQAQTHQNWALLIHDDGSTDETVALIQRYHAADPRVQLASNQGHLGIKRGFMETLTLAEGDYYAFSDQDDIWHADKLARLVQELDGIDKPALAYSKFQEIDANDQDITDYERHPIFMTQLNKLILTNTVTGCTCMFNKALRDALIAKLDGFDYDQIHMHDWWAAVVASAIGEVRFVDERLISYRQHDHNVLGAAQKETFGARLRNFFALSQKDLLKAGVSQAGLVRRDYFAQLDAAKQALITASAQTLSGWQPLKRWHVAKQNGILTGSRFMNMELLILLWLPSGLRARVLR